MTIDCVTKCNKLQQLLRELHKLDHMFHLISQLCFSLDEDIFYLTMSPIGRQLANLFVRKQTILRKLF